MAKIDNLDLITREQVRSLLEHDGEPKVSIFHPTEQVAVEPEQNSLHLKNLLGEAHDRLAKDGGLRRPQIEELLKPFHELLRRPDFWRHQMRGVGFFRSPDLFRYFRLPFSVDELVVDGPSFHVMPLLPALTTEGHFYLLPISQNDVRLLRCTRYSVEEIDLAELAIPRSLQEATEYDDKDKPELQHHPTMAPGRSDSGPAAPTQAGGRRDLPGRRHAYHGHGQSPDEKVEIERFVHGVEEGITKLVGAEAPLVLAGDDYITSAYRSANQYEFLVDGVVEGSPDRIGSKDLQQRAWAVVEPHFLRNIEGERSKYGSFEHEGLASTDLKEVLVAAEANRVSSLFVARNQHRWGRYDQSTEAVEEHDERLPGDEDLLDLTARKVLLHGGKVFAVEREEIPHDAALAAIYRF